MVKKIDKNKDEIYLFHEGTFYQAYEFLGCHIYNDIKGKSATFRVWAPNAKAVSVVGDFNNWNDKAHKMTKISDGGIWEATIQDVRTYDKYKFSIKDSKGVSRLKADPYGFYQETNCKTASMVFDISGFPWTDKKYLENRKKKNIYESPINIYEVSLSSWKRKPNGEYYTYNMMADELIPYLLEMGYTHVELMPINEFPYDGSWGYQVTGYFAVTSRFGNPYDFMYFVDKCHENGIGVIVDWVPGHFPKDDYGLIEFDGKPLYENKSWDKIEHKAWGTRRFDYAKNEVQSFLISSAMLLLKEYHIDGLRVDAVASMLYLDYDKKPGEWLPNQNGDNKNLEAIAFLQKLNAAVFKEVPNIMMIAEESTAWPMVTKPTNVGGLGFNFKWNMGWMNDSIDYMRIDPYFRTNHHNKLTFSFCYAFSENFILPLSHDEVVHGKGSLLNKMYGDYEERFTAMRAYLAYMIAHPGKKLLFMGNEFAQFREWCYNDGLDFNLLAYDTHRSMRDYVKDLNMLYLSNSELYELDFDWKGFEWLEANDHKNNVLVFNRKDKSNNEILFAVNFSAEDRPTYRVGLDKSGEYEEIFNSNDILYRGTGFGNKKPIKTVKQTSHGKEHSILINIPAMSAVFLKRKSKDIKVK